MKDDKNNNNDENNDDDDNSNENDRKDKKDGGEDFDDDLEHEIRKGTDAESNVKTLMDVVVNQYSDKSHFIYELLQNAEDAHAGKIKFVQYDDRLEVIHDGKPFTVSNFRALFSAGRSDKTDDETKIGAFGIGFKSVFSICTKYDVYSDPKDYPKSAKGEEWLRRAYTVTDYFKRKLIADSGWSIDDGYTTKFVFYYDVRFASDKKFSDGETISSIIDTIREKLETLSSETLLFLKHLKSIKYDIRLEDHKSSGAYMLEITDIKDNCYRVDTLSENSRGDAVADSDEISYLVFAKSVAASNYERTVNVAFAFTEGDDGKWIFRPAPSPYISVFFPTSTESKLNFLVQGPYRTTPNRSEIRPNSDNKELAQKTADLLCDSIRTVKQLGRLDLSFLNILPLSRSKFIGNSGELLICLYDSVADLLKNEELLPCKYGGFTSARNARLVRGKDLSDVFDDADLTVLARFFKPLHWLPDIITSNTYQDLHGYLRGLGIVEHIPENIPGWIKDSNEFLPSKSTEWLVSFYNYLADQQSLFYRKGKPSDMMTVKFVKTQDGSFVAPFTLSEKEICSPNVFLSDDQGREGFLFVDGEIYKQCRYFFDKILNLSKPNYYDVWVTDYKQRKGIPISDEQHRDDLMSLEKYLNDGRYSAELKKEIMPKFLKLRCGGEYGGNFWGNPLMDNIFFPVSEDGKVRIMAYFRDIYSNVTGFINSAYYERIDVNPYIFKGIYGVKDRDEMLTYDGEGMVNGIWGSVYSIISLESALEFIRDIGDHQKSIVKSKVIFTLLVDNLSVISDQTFELLSACQWLHTKTGFKFSKDISKHDIDENEYGPFYENKVLCEKLNFLKDERDDEDEISRLYNSIPDDKREIFVQKWLKSQYGLSLEEVIYLIDNTDFSDESDFPSCSIHDLHGLEEKLLRDFEDAPGIKYETKTTRVRTSKIPSDVDVYAKMMYSAVGTSMKRACQLCHKFHYSTFKTQIEQDGKAQKELPAMYLCLCGDCSKKYKAFRENDDDYNKFVKSLADISDDDLRESPVKVKCDFGSGEEDLWFTQRHAADVRGFVRLIKSQIKPPVGPIPYGGPEGTDLACGMRVQHRKFGRGVITDIKYDDKGNERILVQFDDPSLEITPIRRDAFETSKVIWVIDAGM